MRHRNKRRLEQAQDEESLDGLIFAHKDEVEDVWGFKKDGKWRFDPARFPKEMRK